MYQTIVFRAKFGGGYIYPYLGNDGNIQLMLYAGHMYLTTYQGGQSSSQIDCGAVDSNYHTWRIVWSAGACTLYKDDVQVGQTTTKIPTVTGGSFHIEPDGSGMWFDWWGFLGNTDHYKASLKVGSQTITDKDVQIDNSALNDGYFDSGWVVLTQTGSQTVELKFRNASAAAETKSAQCTWDDLIIMLDTIITIHGLLGGQKVELYDSAGSLRKWGTCPQTGVDVSLTGIDALISTAYGFSGYFKVYDTDGVSLLYTTSTAACWGGDVYTWIPNQSALTISTSQTQIYRTGSGLTPTTATLTVTLTNKDTGAPLSGKTIVWTPNLGTCNPTSGATDANGMASTTYTASASAGLGGVRADFLGNATYGASGVQQLIDQYYGALTVDASKDFQVWIEGQEAVIASGNYKLSTDFRPQAFSFTTPSLDLTVGGWWAVDIYRQGVKEFKGRIWKKSKKSGMNPTLTVTGVNEVVMLQRRVANKGYTDEPKNIILDLLQRYPCGIAAGTIAIYGNVIKLDATYENLFDAFSQIARITGWKFRLNLSNSTLDFGSDFGAVKALTVALGSNESDATHDQDWTQVDSKVYVVGNGAGASLVSVASDPTVELVYGLIEEAFLEKNISDQGTLDLRAIELLSQRAQLKETISLNWIDSNATGAYAPYDTLTVTDADAELSTSYKVQVLQRNLLDANLATLELTNIVVSFADVLQLIRKDVKDMGVA